MGRLDITTIPRTREEQDIMLLIIVYCETACRDQRKAMQKITVSSVMTAVKKEFQERGIWKRDFSRKKKKKSPFECKCPPDLKSGKNGYYHRTPIDCLTTKAEIDKGRKWRKWELRHKKKKGRKKKK